MHNRCIVRMIRTLAIYYLISLAASSMAQETSTLELLKKESELQSLFQILYSDTLSAFGPVLDQIQEIMPDALAEEGAMEFTWSKLDRIGVISSDDGNVRIFTWHVMEDPDHYRYYGYIQMNLKRDQIRVFELKDNLKPQRNLNRLEQSPENWFGKLYYQIIAETYKRDTYYTLMGMDFNNSRSTIKTIETISIHRRMPRFEQGMYLVGNNQQDRMVLEYSSQVSISVRYDPAIRMITYDHLEPLHPVYRNNFEFYGPDGSIDGLQFTDGAWIFVRDIDARNSN